MFESMLSHRGDSGCEGKFYTYDSFIKAAKKFPDFGTAGSDEIRRRELAAFFGQTSHETSGYCYVNELQKTDPPYYGRGPIQLTHKYNYDAAGRALMEDLVGAAAAEAVVPRRDDQRLDALSRRPRRGEAPRLRPDHQHHQRRGGVWQGPANPRRHGPVQVLQDVLPDARGGAGRQRILQEPEAIRRLIDQVLQIR
ncbi:unnamed protein product [Urochloa humidicola]